MPSGGIGSTINITTARPFDFSGMRATFQAKATDDTSSKVGAKVTPEFSGLFSDTFFDEPLRFPDQRFLLETQSPGAGRER